MAKGLRSGAEAANAQNSNARSHALGSSSLKNRTANANKSNGMGNNRRTCSAEDLARPSGVLAGAAARKTPCRISGLGSPGAFHGEVHRVAGPTTNIGFVGSNVGVQCSPIHANNAVANAQAGALRRASIHHIFD